ADRNRSHWSTSKTPSYTKSVSWQHHRLLLLTQQFIIFITYPIAFTGIIAKLCGLGNFRQLG
ncbi:hypothetical protein P9380_17295, partial [Escherichia coli]|uniref:hypothetical protein n=1 Tax=Escherichia coli TaxID=562 RepID=UPI003892352C